MLPKSRKITRQTFPHQRSGGFVAHTPHLSCVFFPSQEENTRFSAVISKKIAASSPARHLWKRRIYEAVSSYEKKRSSHLPGGSYVVYAKKGVVELPYSSLASEVQNVLENIRGQR